MRYWWVNQNKTYKHEVPGGYMWSPKRNKGNRVNRAYEAMRTINPGDCVFSFAGTEIKAIGFSNSVCYSYPKPIEFGKAGSNWGDSGWRVDVNFKIIPNPIKPRDHIGALLPMLPEKYSPLQSSGRGNQTFYLYEIDRNLAIAIAQLMDHITLDLVRGHKVFDEELKDKAFENILLWEDAIEDSISKNNEIPETTRSTLIQSRRGQGKFRAGVLGIEHKCRITQVRNKQHLIASHTKPWRDCTNEERLDPENGFMLTPTIDHLFDRGFISFENNGELVISPVADQGTLIKMGIPIKENFNVGKFTDGQKSYLQSHRDSFLLASKV